MPENQESNSLGGTLERILHGDFRRRIKYDENTGEFVLEDADTPLENGQDATPFAGEGFAA